CIPSSKAPKVSGTHSGNAGVADAISEGERIDGIGAAPCGAMREVFPVAVELSQPIPQAGQGADRPLGRVWRRCMVRIMAAETRFMRRIISKWILERLELAKKGYVGSLLQS